MTEWGRQFWRITGRLLHGQAERGGLGAVGAAAVVDDHLGAHQRPDQLLHQRRLHVAAGRLAGASHPTSDDVTDSGIHGFWVTIGIFLVLAAMHVVLVLLDMYVTQRFIMRWRIWLSSQADRRLARRLRLLPQSVLPSSPIDNPDQRIQQDIDIFTTGVGGRTEQPGVRLGQHPVVRRRRGGAVGDLVRRDPVAAVRALDARRRHGPPARCSGSSSSTCWRPPSSRSSSAGR